MHLRHSLQVGALAVAIVTAPLRAHAAWTIAGSFGQGLEASPRSGAARATSLMVAPGYGVGEALRVELGLAGTVDAAKRGLFDFEVRPMLVVAPPGFPIYGRFVAAAVSLLHGPSAVGLGAALGVDTGPWSGVHFFFEGGVLPRRGVGPAGKQRLEWVAEGQAGIVYPLSL